MTRNELENARSLAAEEELENYDFYECEFVDSSGWEFSSGTDVLEKPIFMKSPEAGADADSELGSFKVEFETGTDTVISAEAKLQGNEIGHRGASAPAPGL